MPFSRLATLSLAELRKVL